MKLLTLDATLVCAHENGVVGMAVSQHLVTINGRPILVEADPEQRPIVGCPMVGIGIYPCNQTLKVQAGYSDLIRIDKHRVCLDTVTGLTNGTPPGTVIYKVRSPGQNLVSEV
ncbi:MAG: hypothetical protein HY080_02790 [Gammaproteobacteria bacterium]|nr:hypothetical protein [Gammaproteobacteria bacterium]